MTDVRSPSVRARATAEEGTMTTETTPSATNLIDEFLGKHGAGLPGHIIDFALDVRTVIGELEAELARAGEPVGV